MLAYGRNVAEKILKDENLRKKVKTIFIEKNFFQKIDSVWLKNEKLPLKVVEKKELDRLSNGKHQGIIIDMEDYQYTPIADLFKEDISFILILDHLEDPHNLGAMIRTAVAAGVDAIIMPSDRQVGVNATVLKASAGTLYDTKVVQVVNLNHTIELLKKDGFWFYGAAMNGEDYRKVDYASKVALVIGNEGKGLSKLITKNCDFLISIPMKNNVESLNASVACSLLLYEVVRNRK